MKKQLLLGAFLMGSFLTANAQDSCDDAMEVSTGETTVEAIEGTYPEGTAGEICAFAEGDPTAAGEDDNLAAWYAFTPDGNGLLSIEIAADVDIDTRMRLLSGTCDGLTCVAVSDDISYPADLRSQLLNVPVEDGVTYYIVFDNMWAGSTGTANDGGIGGFNFDVSFEEVTCFGVTTGFMLTEAPSPTSVSIGWDAPIGEPESYDVIWGAPDFDPATQGTTISGLETPGVEISGLTAESNYEFYVYTNCSGGESVESGPIAFSTISEPDSFPYENSFDDADDLADGIWSEGWTFATNDMVDDDPFTNYAQDDDGFAFTSTQGESWMFKGFNADANQTITVSFYASYLGDADDDAMIAVTSGTEAWADSQAEVETFAVAGAGAGEYEMFTAEFDVQDAGVYYVGFHNMGGTTGGFSLLVDSIEITSGTAGINDVLASKFSIFPNPASNVIGFSNADNILVNGVVITDLNGRTVKTVNYAGVTEAQINISDLAAGMYMMTVSSDQGTMSKKIVKN